MITGGGGGRGIQCVPGKRTLMGHIIPNNINEYPYEYHIIDSLGNIKDTCIHMHTYIIMTKEEEVINLRRRWRTWEELTW